MGEKFPKIQLATPPNDNAANDNAANTNVRPPLNAYKAPRKSWSAHPIKLKYK